MKKSAYLSDSVYLTETVVVGSDFSPLNTNKPSIVFINKNKKIRKTIVNKNGKICNFPGIITEDFQKYQISSHHLNPQVNFRLSFENREDKWLVLWMIQPDGRYWEDEDGYGAEPDEEITLYTYLDKEGNFTAPFSLYRIGRQSFLC